VLGVELETVPRRRWPVGRGACRCWRPVVGELELGLGLGFGGWSAGVTGVLELEVMWDTVAVIL
jgi:hypothetical protein